METSTKSKGLGVQKESIDFAGLRFQLHFHNYLKHMGFVGLVDIFFHIFFR